MTTALATDLGWEIHRPRTGRPTAVAYRGDTEAKRLAGPLLRLQVVVWSWLLAR